MTGRTEKGGIEVAEVDYKADAPAMVDPV